jgi:hypothetical protein
MHSEDTGGALQSWEAFSKAFFFSSFSLNDAYEEANEMHRETELLIPMKERLMIS